MSKIEKIIIACYKKDIWFTRICVASIRYWYPTIPIYLIKDFMLGHFDTSEIEQSYKVSVFDTKGKRFGWGFSKFEVLFSKSKERVLLIDSDIVFLGKVIDFLESFDEDFIVSPHIIANPKSELFRTRYFDINKLLNIDPNYIYPGFAFNTGQIVVTCGKISQSDFLNFVDWTEPPALKRKDIFSLANQGILNYILVKKCQLGKLSMGSHRFMYWAFYNANPKFEVSKIKNRQSYPCLMHWAGFSIHVKTKSPPLSKMPYSDILKFYNTFYYSEVKFGKFLKYLRSFVTYLKWKKIL